MSAVSWYLEVKSPSIGALKEALTSMGHGHLEPSPGGRLGYEIHYWTVRQHAQDVADELTARGYRAQVEAKN